MSSTQWWKFRQPPLAGWIPLITVTLLCGLPVAGAAQPQPPDPDRAPPAAADAAESSADDPVQPPVFRSEINFVRVDAIVTDRDGNPLRDLTIDDFEIFEDDVLQQVETFKLIEHTGEFDPILPPPSSIRNAFDLEREAAREDSRIFVFFLDDYHVRDYNAIRITQPLVDFVQNELAPTDLVGIMYPLTPAFDVTLTRDHEQIVHALQRFEGRKYDYDPRNMYEMEYAHYPTTAVEKIRNDVSLSALKALAIKLGGLREGRKSIIVLSEGIRTTCRRNCATRAQSAAVCAAACAATPWPATTAMKTRPGCSRTWACARIWCIPPTSRIGTTRASTWSTRADWRSTNTT